MGHSTLRKQACIINIQTCSNSLEPSKSCQCCQYQLIPVPILAHSELPMVLDKIQYWEGSNTVKMLILIVHNYFYLCIYLHSEIFLMIYQSFSWWNNQSLHRKIWLQERWQCQEYQHNMREVMEQRDLMPSQNTNWKITIKMQKI